MAKMNNYFLDLVDLEKKINDLWAAVLTFFVAFIAVMGILTWQVLELKNSEVCVVKDGVCDHCGAICATSDRMPKQYQLDLNHEDLIFCSAKCMEVFLEKTKRRSVIIK